MDFMKVAETSDVQPGQMKRIEVAGNEILLANIEGKFFAVSNKCSHMGGDLSKGKLEGGSVVCPRHGSRFDLITGKAISGPKVAFFKLKTGDIPSYEVKIEGSSVFIKV
uniref:Non-heme iron oxygenase ferredoxin subunit n=1 Tax=Candidatus Methanomethylicus mesodigestus TaxID=1867258 RepID=A0A7C3J2K6_9CREN